MHGLYAIADVDSLATRGLDPVTFAEAVVSVRPAALQLRAKSSPPREVLGWLRALACLCRKAKLPLVANDRADLAVLAGCDMVHVGQDDFPVELARRIAPTLGIGISTHSLEQLRRALADAPSYVAFGPVFPTRSKRGADPVVGTSLLAEAHVLAKAAGIPLVAIGGITLENAAQVRAHCDAAAVIGGLLPESLPTSPLVLREVLAERAASLHEALGGTRSASPPAVTSSAFRAATHVP
ncbi:MAG: thiamine phosphate synthase [Polyangiaceae bacterium]